MKRSDLLNNIKACLEDEEDGQGYLYDHINNNLTYYEHYLVDPAETPGDHKEPTHPYTATQDLVWLRDQIWKLEGMGAYLAHPQHVMSALHNVSKALGIEGFVAPRCGTVDEDDIQLAAAQMLDLIRTIRQKNILGPIMLDDKLDTVIQGWSERLALRESRLVTACERIEDMLRGDDAQAYKEAEKFLQQVNYPRKPRKPKMEYNPFDVEDSSLSEWKNIVSEFEIADEQEKKEPDEIFYAAYTYESYSGSANVIYRRGDKYYQVTGGHCSCYGLEDQWKPEEYDYDTFMAMIDRIIAQSAKENYLSEDAKIWKLVKERAQK